MACHESASLGAYLLGALDPVERSTMTRHIAGCRRCRAQLLEMAPLPGLLQHTRFEEPKPAALPHTAPAARNRTVAGTGGRRRLRLRRDLIASALAVAATATAIGLYIGTSTPSAGPPPAAATVSATDPSTHVAASATLTAEPTGTMVRLTLTGLPPGTTYLLVVHADDGDSETAAGWASGRSTTDTLPASTAVPLSDITSLDVVSSSGHLLVALPQP